MIHIAYLHSLPDVSQAQRQTWLNELPESYRQRLQRLRVPKCLLQSLTGLQLVKLMATELGLTSFQLTQLSSTEHGKPQCSKIHDFSISHSEELVACAMTTTGSIGLDVEQIHPVKFKHFVRVFNDQELAWIGEDYPRFFDLWTRKEAVIKASGVHGIGQLHDIQLNTDQATLENKILHLQSLNLHPDYATCIAVTKPQGKITISQAKFNSGKWTLEQEPPI